MSLRRRRTRPPTGARALARKTSRERIIPSPIPAQTPVWHVKAVTVHGSLPVAVICLPLLAPWGSVPPRLLPVIALFLTAAHGSVLVHRRISRR